MSNICKRVSKAHHTNYTLLCIFLCIVFFKIIFLFFFLDFIQSKSLDAESYHLYALGFIDNGLKTNFWANILRHLNNMGIYSRFSLTIIIFIIGNILVPFQFAKLSTNKSTHQYFKINCMIFASLYITVFFYSLDVNRDIFMLSLFLFGVFLIKCYFLSRNTISLLWIIMLSFILISLRSYLGFAYFISFIFSYFIVVNRRNIIAILIFGVAILYNTYTLGFLEKLIWYRGTFSSLMHGHSNINIIINQDDSFFIFLGKFISSAVYQMFGLYLYSPLSCFLFTIESIPFIISLILFLQHIKNNTSNFISFLFIFFLTYSSVWIIGNDNLGTAARVRIFSYISVYIGCFYLFQQKLLNLTKTNKYTNNP